MTILRLHMYMYICIYMHICVYIHIYPTMLYLCPYLNFLPFYLYMFMIGRVSNPGSTALIMCVNPLPNFIIGYIVLASLLVIAVPYIFMGRFHKIAHRRERGALAYVRDLSKKLQKRITIKDLV